MKKNPLLIALAMTFVSMFTASLTALADIDAYTFSDDEKLQSYQALTRELRCPKCQNQDIKDSNAPIAKDMRREVHRLVEEGKSHDEVVSFMVERFGEFVTYKPKIAKETLVFWYGPFVFVLIGLVFIVVFVKTRGSDTKNQKDSTDSVSAVDDVSTTNKAGLQETLSSNVDSNSSVSEILKKYDD